MKRIILSSAIALMGLGMFANTQAKECFNADTIDVKWVSYKTMAKIGVGGNFSKTNLDIAHTNAVNVQELLKGAKVALNLNNLDAHLMLKNKNIATFFTAHLGSKAIDTKVIEVYSDTLIIEVTLNNMTQKVPMSYKIEGSKIIATGVIDALDFELVPALNILNKNVAGHLNKGWNDISISFAMGFVTTCR